MAQTDDPFKLLILEGSVEFAKWFLKKPVKSVRELSKELFKKTKPLRPDLIFEVTMEDGNKTILHVEFQGPKTDQPMAIRELWYIALIAAEYPGIPIMSIVLYVGSGAGTNDTGHHKILHPDGGITIEWHYEVIHLAKVDAEEILEVGIDELLPLVGQTRMKHPQKIFPRVISRLEQVPDPNKRKNLFKILVYLTTSKKGWNVLKGLIDIDEMYDTPFVQEERQKGYQRGLAEGVEKGNEQGRQEGRQEGLQEGRQEGRQEGLQEGLQKGIFQLLRSKILDILSLRFNASESELHKVEAVLVTIHQQAELDKLFETALRIESVDEFWNILFRQ